MPAACNMLWIGDRIGAVERACIRSVLAQQHALTLWCYEEPAGVPAGVVLQDAADILPAAAVLRHESGSVSLFSNWFRYELQRLGKGMWLDCDVYLLRPLPRSDHVLALEDKDTINGSVFRLPQESPMIEPLLRIFREPRVPPWLPLRAKLKAHARRALSGGVDLSKMPWGVSGPRAITAIAREQGMMDRALPADVFHPVHWKQAHWIFDPQLRLEQCITSRTVGVHLWNERIRSFKDLPAAKGSFLARLQEEGAL